MAKLFHDGDDEDDHGEDDHGKDDGMSDPYIILRLIVVDSVIVVLLYLFDELLLFFFFRSHRLTFESSLYEISAALFTLLRRILEPIALIRLL